MNDRSKVASSSNGETDFIDEIASLLPAEQQPLWYRDMAHLRRLPADDELLRIARAMGFLTLITRQAPVEIAQERQKLTAALEQAIIETNAARQDTIRFHRDIENRLAAMPQQIAEGVNPPAIATILAETLRQHFIQSGLPETAKALALVAKQSGQAATDFGHSCEQVNDTCRSTTKELLEGLSRLRTMMQMTSEEAKEATQFLRDTFLREYKWSLLTLCTSALMLGFSLGIVWHRWISSPQSTQSANIRAISQPSDVQPHPSPTNQQQHKPQPPRPNHETTR